MPGALKNKSLRFIEGFVRTDQRDYFQYLKAFLLLIEPIVDDLKLKGFI